MRKALLAASLVLLLTACGESEVSGTHITHTTPDGLRLSATYTRPNAGPVPTIIVLHQPGSTNSRHDFDDIWDVLEGQGYALIAPDLRSHGLSDSQGSWQDLATDPTGYPNDVLAWLDFIADREDAGDPLTRSAVGIIGLGTSGSLAAAALGKGHVDCAVAVSANLEELVALHPGFEPYSEGDDDDSSEARGDDDDSAADDDDDDDSAGTDEVPEELALHTIRFVVSEGDEPSATDSALMNDASADPHDLVSFPGSGHGVELIWLSDESKMTMIDWCGDKF